MLILKNIKKYFPLIVLLTIGIITIFGLKIYLQRNIERNVDLWKIYRSSEGGYELKYPPNWYVSHWYFGEKDCSVSCKGSPDPSSCESSCLKNFLVQNKKEIYVTSLNRNSITWKRVLPYSILKILEGPGLVTKKGSLFRFGVLELIPKYSTIKTMEDWITKDELTYPKYQELEGLHEAVKERNRREYEENKKTYLDRAKKSQQEEIKNLVEMEIGNIKTKVSAHKVNSYTWRLDFIYGGKIYQLAYVSGSQEQFEKDDEIFEKIIDSLKIY